MIVEILVMQMFVRCSGNTSLSVAVPIELAPCNDGYGFFDVQHHLNVSMHVQDWCSSPLLSTWLTVAAFWAAASATMSTCTPPH